MITHIVSLPRVYSCHFRPKTRRPQIQGFDYDKTLDSLKPLKDEGKKACRNIKIGRNVQDAREKLILERVYKAIIAAREFVKEMNIAPQDVEDIIQDALLASVEAGKIFYPMGGKSFNTYSALKEQRALRASFETAKTEILFLDEMDEDTKETEFEAMFLNAQNGDSEKLREKIIDFINTTLFMREAEVLKARMGFGVDKPLSMRQIAQKYHTSVKLIKNANARAYKKLKNPQNKKELREIYDKYLK